MMIARLTAREWENGSAELIVGKVLNQSKSFKPNTVYELREIMDELMIVEVGPVNDQTVWNSGIQTVISNRMKDVLTTKEENGN